MAKCDVRNCVSNDEGICEDCHISADGYCLSKVIDEDKCEYCGTELVELKDNLGEHFGFPCSETYFWCPNGCYD